LVRARAYIDAGFREIVVTGCNLCLYRDSNRRLPELVSAIAGLESSGHRVRLGSIEPGLCDTSLLDAMEANPNICRFVHLSLQSGSNRILRLMRRPYTIEKVAEFCADARRRFGERLAFGADVITGFPGETDADFETTKAFLSSHLPLLIPHLHIFPYSEREGTEAATMKIVVPVEVRRARAKELETIAAANHERFARSLIGQEVQVCVERDGNGRTDEYVRCVLKGTAPRRSIVRAMVDDYFPKTGSLSATIRA
jgi:threonylcarbamoyladenosine tRNA methylthiotransferase MtaB